MPGFIIRERKMSGQRRFKCRWLRLVLIVLITASVAGAWRKSLYKAGAGPCLVATVTQVNAVMEAAATRMVWLLTECEADFTRF